MRCYFHLCDEAVLVEDRVGQLVETDTEAMYAALLAARDLAASSPVGEGAIETRSLIVEDGTKRVVGRVSLSSGLVAGAKLS
jgi:hypothetical protein